MSLWGTYSPIHTKAIFLWLPLLGPQGTASLHHLSMFSNQNVTKCSYIWMPGSFVGCAPDDFRGRCCFRVLGGLNSRSTQWEKREINLSNSSSQPEYNQFLFILPIVPNVHFLSSLRVSICCARETDKLLWVFVTVAHDSWGILERVKKWIFLLTLYVCRWRYMHCEVWYWFFTLLNWYWSLHFEKAKFC